MEKRMEKRLIAACLSGYALIMSLAACTIPLTPAEPTPSPSTQPSPSIQPPAAAPAVPQNLAAAGSVSGDPRITLSWDAVGGADSYNLYWATAEGVSTASGTKVAGVASPFKLEGLANGTTYHIVVTAVNGAGESAPSQAASARPQFAQGTMAFTERTVMGAQYWADVTVSSDGTRVTAVAHDGVYRSTDSGANWTKLTLAFTTPADHKINGSADGMHLVVSPAFLSKDGGSTWTTLPFQGDVLAISADGNRLAGARNGYICTSADGGATWTERTAAGQHFQYAIHQYAIASSADGLTLAAVSGTDKRVFLSSDAGASWQAVTPSTAEQYGYEQVALSADGRTVVAAGSRVCVSRDGGTTWTEPQVASLSASTSTFRITSIVASADGSHIAAIDNSNIIYLSSDGGVHWTNPASLAGKIAACVGLGSGGAALVVLGTTGAVITSPDFGASAVERNLPSPHGWRSVALDAGGNRIAAGDTRDNVMTSADTGATWKRSGIGTGGWGSSEVSSISSSSDGSRLGAVLRDYYSGWVYSSTDYGATWTLRTGAYRKAIIAGNADGSRLWVSAPLMFSTDFGATLTLSNSTLSNEKGTVCSNANGLKIVACTITDISVYPYSIVSFGASADGGASWTARDLPSDSGLQSIVSSADGQKLAAISGRTLYTSSDAGATWTARTEAGARDWGAIASSADGAKLAAIERNGRLFTSGDGGATWLEQPAAGVRNWTCVALNADGSRLAAAADNSNIFVSQ
jgi:photosystem II stability/assembly factor-like uncharacterized protein